MRWIRAVVVLITGVYPPVLCSEVPHTFQENTPAKAGQVNDNFEYLQGQIQELNDPSSHYSYIEQVDLGDGRTWTKLYYYEQASYSSFMNTNHVIDNDSGTEIRSVEYDFHESLVNALGAFRSEGRFQRTNEAAPSDPNAVDIELPVSCPGGATPIRFPFEASYDLTLRNEAGAIILGTHRSPMSDIYTCLPFTYEGRSYEFGVYYILEGEGIGAHECIESILYYGADGAGLDTGYVKAASGDITVGYFNPESNGLPGTYYLEIVAPNDCLPKK